jgi:Domain of unknown function (DUF4386)
MPPRRADLDAGRGHFDWTSNIAACMNAAAQVEYESGVRVRYGALAFLAALLLVASQLLLLTASQSAVSEATVSLINANKSGATYLIGDVVEMFGLFALVPLFAWLYRVSKARNPGIKPITRWMAVIGAALAGVMFTVYIVLLVSKAHTFVTTGNQGYPEAYALTKGGMIRIAPYFADLGELLLAIGCIFISLNAMRVGLFTKPIGYGGIVAGAMFLFPIAALAPLIQGLWLTAVAVTFAGRWPKGDFPAWERGEAVAWPGSGRLPPGPAEQRSRPSRAERRKVSDKDVLAAVDQSNGNGTPSPSTSAGKRKRKRK